MARIIQFIVDDNPNDKWNFVVGGMMESAGSLSYSESGDGAVLGNNGGGSFVASIIGNNCTMFVRCGSVPTGTSQQNQNEQEAVRTWLQSSFSHNEKVGNTGGNAENISQAISRSLVGHTFTASNGYSVRWVADSDDERTYARYYVYDNNGRALASNVSDPNFRYIRNKLFGADWENFKNASSAVNSRAYTTKVSVGAQVSLSNVAITPSVQWEVGSNIGNIDWLWYIVHTIDPSKETDMDNPYNEFIPPYTTPQVPTIDPYDPGDDIPIPDDPPVSLSDTGLMEVYTPSITQLNLLAQYLWSSNFFTGLIKDLYADPIDVILSLGIVPFNVTAGGTKNIKVGDRDSEVTSAYPASTYVTLDCGSINIGYTSGSYLDFEPYTKLTLYLPYVGMVRLSMDDFMGKALGVTYKFDITTGDGVSFVTANGKVLYTYSCNVLMRIPLTGASYTEMWGSLVAATIALATAGAAAPALGATAGAAEAGAVAASSEGGAIASTLGDGLKSASGIMDSLSTKPTIQKSNNVGMNAGALGVRKPYVIIERPNACIPASQRKYRGYPSYIEGTLGSFSGYTKVSEINLSVPGATDRELSEISTFLKSGVIIGSGVTPSGSGDIVLIRNGSPVNQIGKALTAVSSLSGSYRGEIDIMEPVFEIQYSGINDFDYVYIPAFGRCYFVEDKTIPRTDLIRCTCRVDVLQSFMSGILTNSAVVDSSETKYNLLLNDGSLKTYQNPLIQTWSLPSGFYENNNYEYVLVVAGN